MCSGWNRVLERRPAVKPQEQRRLQSVQNASPLGSVAELSADLRKRLDNTSPRVLVEYLAERLGSAAADEALSRI